MRPQARRFPVRETAFVAALVLTASLVSWLSGRTLVLQEALSPLLGGAQTAANTLNDGVDRVKSLQRLQAENAELKAQLVALETAVRERDEQAIENRRLHALLKFPLPAAARPLNVARVIGRNPDNWHQRLLIDKGVGAEVALSTVAASSKGLVGKVVTVGGATALVSLLTDPTFAVSVINTRTRSAGVVQGQGDPWPVARYMDQPEKWRAGDRLITSGLGGTYPKGLPVGRIVKLERPGAVGASELRVEPAVPLERLEEVVLMPAGIAEMPTPKPSPTPTPSPKPSPSGVPG